MSLLSRLFGSRSAPKTPEPILHKDCRIYPDPIREGAIFRIAARIEKDFGGQTRTHRLIRADTRSTADEAAQASADKARQAIDQLGDSLFG
ncbi:MAG: HlyU family transcriptional regulator [Paracoccaceae bacterium]